jgi:uncharacterized protein
VFLLVALSVVGGMHLYLASRLVLDLALPSAAQTGGLLGLAFLAAMLVIGAFAQRTASPTIARALAIPAFVWLGLVWLLLSQLVVTDLAAWLASLTGLYRPPDPVEFARWRAAVVGVVAVVLAAWGMFRALGGPRVRRREVHLKGWPAALDGYRLVHISDLHLGPMLGAGFARRLTRQINGLESDLVAVTGDLVDGAASRYRDRVEPLEGLRPRDGVYFVTGNHDHYSGAAEWTEVVTSLGWHALRNRRVDVRGGFQLAGVDDRQSAMLDGTGEDLTGVLHGRDEDRPLVLLAHQPLVFTAAADAGVDLQLSGHTHGGQIIPFQLMVRWVYSRFVSGLYRVGDAQLHVSPGTGFWGPPIRVGAPAEITVLEIRAKR